MEYHYRCRTCGHLVEPYRGELNSGIKPDTPWEEYPEDWICPICSAPTSNSYPIESDGW